MFYVLWPLLRVLGGLERSGGPVGFIPTRSRTMPTPWDRVMAKKPVGTQPPKFCIGFTIVHFGGFAPILYIGFSIGIARLRSHVNTRAFNTRAFFRFFP